MNNFCELTRRCVKPACIALAWFAGAIACMPAATAERAVDRGAGLPAHAQRTAYLSTSLRQPPALDQPPVDDAVIDAEQSAAAAAAEAIDQQDEPLYDPEADARRIYRPISQVTVNTALPPGPLPETMERQDGDPPPVVMPEVGDMRLEGGWGDQLFEWSATQFCHRPLYFEEVNLERYGYQCNPLVQPLVSGAHFFLTVPALPYKMTVEPPRECVYTLGYYRPGDRVPWQRNRLPWDARAAAVEAGVAVGLVFLIP